MSLNSTFFENNRKRFLQSLPNDSVTLIYSGKEIAQSLDQNYPFYVDNNYYYLTGLKEPGGLLALTKDKRGFTGERLFIPKVDPLQEKWTGFKYSPIQASRISGIKEIAYDEDFHDYFEGLDDYKLLGLDHSQVKHQRLIPNKEVDKEVFDVSEILQKLRLKKDENEIEQLGRAIGLTEKGINAILSELHPGMRESEIAALFEYQIKKNGADGLSFETIVASGPNGPILHYTQNNRKIERNELVLLDLGARYNGYCADISRTFPASGKFSLLQEKFYTALLNAQKRIIKLYVKDALLPDIQKAAKEIIAEELEGQGIEIPVEGIEKWYYHNIGHSLGLDTHDGHNRNLKLENGMVITCEPGVYVKEHNIGIRIEDDILINDDEPVVLSSQIPKELHEIEALLN